MEITKRDLDLHSAWLRGDAKGVRLDRRDVDLTGVDLAGANLTGAYLTGAYLFSANLTGADLSSANLFSANLTGADLSSANLTGANLTGADLSSANLTRANLTGADLTGADLTGADLTGADLRGADLTGADLDSIKDDMWSILDVAPAEVAGLRLALIEGRVDGSTYSGPCACLVGTIANLRGVDVDNMDDIPKDDTRPAERWFLAIRKNAPIDHPVVAITLGWVDEWIARHHGTTTQA